MLVGGRGSQGERDRERVCVCVCVTDTCVPGAMSVAPVAECQKRVSVDQCPCACSARTCAAGVASDSMSPSLCLFLYLLRTLQHPQVSQWHKRNGVGLHSGFATPACRSQTENPTFTPRTNIHKNMLLQMYAVKQRIMWF